MFNTTGTCDNGSTVVLINTAAHGYYNYMTTTDGFVSE